MSNKNIELYLNIDDSSTSSDSLKRLETVKLYKNNCSSHDPNTNIRDINQKLYNFPNDWDKNGTGQTVGLFSMGTFYLRLLLKKTEYDKFINFLKQNIPDLNDKFKIKCTVFIDENNNIELEDAIDDYISLNEENILKSVRIRKNPCKDNNDICTKSIVYENILQYLSRSINIQKFKEVVGEVIMDLVTILILCPKLNSIHVLSLPKFDYSRIDNQMKHCINYCKNESINVISNSFGIYLKYSHRVDFNERVDDKIFNENNNNNYSNLTFISASGDDGGTHSSGLTDNKRVKLLGYPQTSKYGLTIGGTMTEISPECKKDYSNKDNCTICNKDYSNKEEKTWNVSSGYKPSGGSSGGGTSYNSNHSTSILRPVWQEKIILTDDDICSLTARTDISRTVTSTTSTICKDIIDKNYDENKETILDEKRQYRLVPDISALSNTEWYLPIITTDPGTDNIILSGGTSIAAPIYAAFFAIVNQERQKNSDPKKSGPIGFVNKIIYDLPDKSYYFNDITEGNIHSGYKAHRGYDLCTGWGTPNFKTLLELFTGTDTEITNVWNNSNINNIINLEQNTSLGSSPVPRESSQPISNVKDKPPDYVVEIINPVHVHVNNNNNNNNYVEIIIIVAVIIIILLVFLLLLAIN